MHMFIIQDNSGLAELAIKESFTIMVFNVLKQNFVISLKLLVKIFLQFLGTF